MSKLYYLVDNGIKDVVLNKQVALTTLDFHKKQNDCSWVNPYIKEVEIEGEKVEGHINTIITVTKNGEPYRAFYGHLINSIELLDKYMEEQEMCTKDYRLDMFMM